MRGSVPWLRHLLPVPARSHTEHEAPAAHPVERGDLLRGHDRVALVHQADARGELQLARDGRGGGQRHERVVGVAVLHRELAAGRVRRLAARGDVGVLGNEERLEAVLLDQTRQLIRLGRVVGGECEDADLHAVGILPGWAARCLGDFAQALELARHRELLQRLRLELAHALGRHAQAAAGLAQRSRLAGRR